MAIQPNPNIPHMPPASSPGFVAGTPDWVKNYIQKASDKHGIPTIVLSALLKQESGFNTKAQSPAGAQGIAQFMPGTAQGMGVNPWDPESAINGAAQYLKNAYNKFGKMDLALASYNAGTGAVEKYGGIPPYKETQNYVKNIMAMAGQPHESANGPYLSLLEDLKKQSQPDLTPKKTTSPMLAQVVQPRQPSIPQPQYMPNFAGVDLAPPTRPSRGVQAITNEQIQELYNPNGGQLASNLT